MEALRAPAAKEPFAETAEFLREPAGKEPVQGLRRIEHLRAPATKEHVQGLLRIEYLRAHAANEHVQGLRCQCDTEPAATTSDRARQHHHLPSPRQSSATDSREVR